jgi:hypothetical protein
MTLPHPPTPHPAGTTMEGIDPEEVWFCPECDHKAGAGAGAKTPAALARMLAGPSAVATPGSGLLLVSGTLGCAAAGDAAGVLGSGLALLPSTGGPFKRQRLQVCGRWSDALLLLYASAACNRPVPSVSCCLFRAAAWCACPCSHVCCSQAVGGAAHACPVPSAQCPHLHQRPHPLIHRACHRWTPPPRQQAPQGTWAQQAKQQQARQQQQAAAAPAAASAASPPLSSPV